MTRRSAIHDPPLNRRAVDLMLAALAAAVLPHLSHLPLMIVILWIAFSAWRWLAAHRGWPLPGMPLRTLLTVLVIAVVYFRFGTVFGREAGAALLVIMLGLKLLEVRRYRDAVVVLFLGYFLAVMMVLFSQDLWALGLLVIALLMITAALIELHHPVPEGGASYGQLTRRSAALLAQAVPLMLIMFVLFPRIPGPLWGLPDDAYGGTTGLADSMSPGSISALGRSDQVAFRVRFDGATPPAEQLYWRGPVFWYTDGRSWSPGARRPEPAAGVRSPVTGRGNRYPYTMTLEPHNRRWLFALEMPVESPANARASRDLTLVADEPVRTLTRYRVQSVTDYRAGGLDDTDRRRALQLPNANPRARALGAAWRSEEPNPAAIVGRALAHFHHEPFHYTLEPPLLGGNPIDEFLFDTRRGFCEHYAAAFTVLMRAAGIPARVVTGYHGGERNPFGDYLIIRQRDAHAWAEVWYLDRGWVRVDPTAAVAPHRIEEPEANPFSGGESMRSSLESGVLEAIWRQASFGWDTVNNRWNQWVLAYGPATQSEFLSHFGLRSGTGMALAMMAGIGLLLGAITVVLLFRRRDGDPVLSLYDRFCNKLARRGIERAPAEGPAMFAERARRRRPDLAGAIDAIIRRYIAIRYGGARTERQLRRLRRDIHQFRP